MKDRLEVLLRQYKKDASKENFDSLFTESHKVLLSFLLSKNMQFDDAEDLLQDFFIKEFDKSIKTYREDTNRSFFAYLQYITSFRFLSFHSKLKRRKEDRLSNIKELAIPSPDTPEQGDLAKELILGEMKEFFKGLVLSIKNKNHRNAFILRLCMPIKVSSEESAFIMGISVSTYTTWLYRAVLSLKKIIREKKSKGLINFDFEDIEFLLRQKTFSFDREMLNNISDCIYKKVLSLYFFEKKDIALIGKELSLEEERVLELFRLAMFVLLGLLNRKDILLRKGETIMLNQDNIVNFIESLDGHREGGFMRRSVVTTGDRELDKSLRIIHNIFRKEAHNVKEPLSLKDKFLNLLSKGDLSLKELSEKLGLSNADIQSLLREDLSDTDLKRKIHSFVDNYAEGISDNNGEYDTAIFDKANKDLLDRYYKEKEA